MPPLLKRSSRQNSLDQGGNRKIPDKSTGNQKAVMAVLHCLSKHGKHSAEYTAFSAVVAKQDLSIGLGLFVQQVQCVKYLLLGLVYCDAISSSREPGKGVKRT